MERFRASGTYPGSLRAATPGDTRCYMGKMDTLLTATDRHYWRAVTDDPEVQRYVTLRVRFKEEVCVGDRFETHAHIVSVCVPAACTVAQLLAATQAASESPYVAMTPFTLAVDGKELDGARPIAAYNITEYTDIDALAAGEDHLTHLSTMRAANFNETEITPELELEAPYAELKHREVVGTRNMRYGSKPSKSPLARYGATQPGI
jgi:hypothetical protein